MKDFRNTVLNIENDTEYNKELNEKLEIINTKYKNKSLDSTYNETIDESLIIPALYSVFKNLDMYNTNNKPVYENFNEHFIFVENSAGVTSYRDMSSPHIFLYSNSYVHNRERT